MALSNEINDKFKDYVQNKMIDLGKSTFQFAYLYIINIINIHYSSLTLTHLHSQSYTHTHTLTLTVLHSHSHTYTHTSGANVPMDVAITDPPSAQHTPTHKKNPRFFKNLSYIKKFSDMFFCRSTFFDVTMKMPGSTFFDQEFDGAVFLGILVTNHHLKGVLIKGIDTF